MHCKTLPTPGFSTWNLKQLKNEPYKHISSFQKEDEKQIIEIVEVFDVDMDIAEKKLQCSFESVRVNLYKNLEQNTGDEIFGRQNEISFLKQFLLNTVRPNQNGSSLLITGGYATGKTFIIQNILSQIKSTGIVSLNCKLNSISVIDVLHNYFYEPRQYIPAEVKWTQVQSALLTRRKQIILFLDEVDEVPLLQLNKLLEWTEQYPLILLGTSNFSQQLDTLPFANKLTFSEYTQEEVYQLLQLKLEKLSQGYQFFTDTAIKYIVQSLHQKGGLRLIFSLIKKCVQKSTPQQVPLTIDFVKQTLNHNSNYDLVYRIHCLPIKQQYMLLAISIVHSMKQQSSQQQIIYITMNEALKQCKELLKEAKLFDSSQPDSEYFSFVASLRDGGLLEIANDNEMVGLRNRNITLFNPSIVFLSLESIIPTSLKSKFIH